MLQTKKNKTLLADYRGKNTHQTSKEKEIFKKKVLKAESEKFYYFLLTHQQATQTTKNDKKKQWEKQRVLVVRNNDKTKSRKQFLGYKFSERRGFEGLNPVENGPLCDENADASDPNKINYYIVRSFAGEYPPPSNAIKEHCETMDLCDTLNFDDAKSTKSINIKAKVKTEIQPEITSRWEKVRLGDYINFSPKSKRQASYGKKIGKYPFFTSSSLEDKYTDTADYNERSVIIGDGGYSGVHIANHFSVSDHNFVITPKDGLNIDYLYYFLKQNFHILSGGLKGMILQNISKEYVKNIKLPLPPIKNQKKIVAEFTAMDNDTKKADQQKIAAEKKKNDILKKHL